MDTTAVKIKKNVEEAKHYKLDQGHNFTSALSVGLYIYNTYILQRDSESEANTLYL